MKRKSYLKSIRAFCVECMGGNPYLVKDCTAIRCKFYPYRFGVMPETKPDSTPLKSIRCYCLECVGTSDEVKICSAPECPVYYYRFGHNPKRKGKGDVSNLRKNTTQTLTQAQDSTK